MRSFFAIQPPGAPPPQATSPLPLFHPLTMLCTWFGPTDGFQLADALTGVSVFGATGSGKTSGPAAHLAVSYLALAWAVSCSAPRRRSASSGSAGPPSPSAKTTVSYTHLTLPTIYSV